MKESKNKQIRKGVKPVGLPSGSYDEKFPIMLIDHMKEGLSFESFGGVAMVDRSALYQWVEKHEMFAKAKGIGESLGLVFWEREGIVGMKGGKDFNVGVWIFAMKNRFKWHDEKKFLHQGAIDFNQKIDTKYIQSLIKRDPFMEIEEHPKDVTFSVKDSETSKD